MHTYLKKGSQSARRKNDFVINRVKTTPFGEKSQRTLGPKIWSSLTEEVKELIDHFWVGNTINEISMWGASWTLDMHNSMKIQKMSSLVCGFFCILIPYADDFLIPRPSGSL